MREIGEIIAVYVDNKPSVYARIEAYEADIRPGWYLVRMLLLTFPPQDVTWILREAQIDGEPFSMNSIPVILKKVEKTTVSIKEEESPESEIEKSTGKIIKLTDRPTKNRK